jgi:(S)-citramalyl-CoA lyase
MADAATKRPFPHATILSSHGPVSSRKSHEPRFCGESRKRRGSKPILADLVDSPLAQRSSSSAVTASFSIISIRLFPCAADAASTPDARTNKAGAATSYFTSISPALKICRFNNRATAARSGSNSVARMARRYSSAAMGFAAKAAIHPRHVAAINAALAPTAAEIDWARRVLAANAGGVGVVDGKRVDEAMARRASRLTL